MKKISVIIPVYNVEKYLRQCVDSVVCQSMPDYEILLIDDGSPDNSGSICDEYAAKYQNVRVIHKQNGGLSDARNCGIQNAVGEYLVFLDSDDYYDDPDFFEKLVKVMSEDNAADVINFTRKIYCENTGEITNGNISYDTKTIDKLKTQNDILDFVIKNDSLEISACMKAVRRELVIRNGLYFKKGMVSEDVEWSMRLFSLDITLRFLDEAPYINRKGVSTSITSNIGLKNVSDLYSIIDAYADTFNNSDTERGKILLRYLAYQYSILCGLAATLGGEGRRMRSKVKNYAWLLDLDDLSPKTNKAAKLKKLLGITLTMKALGFYLKYRR